jgi:hypothetical protein
MGAIFMAACGMIVQLMPANREKIDPLCIKLEGSVISAPSLELIHALSPT